MKIKVKGSLFHCGRCRKRYSNPFGHVCAARMDRKTPARKTGLSPKVASFGTCGKCKKPVGNPLTHTCTVKSDFKKRSAADAKAKKAAARTAARKSRPEHPYQSCRDPRCERLACRVWREAWQEAWQEGHRDGYREGRNDGHREGYAEGFAAGVAAAGRS